MITAARLGAEAFFLPGSAGRLFSLYRSPRVADDRHRGVLLIPPFAEEMNKSRPMFTMLGTRLAEQGVGVLLTDLYGTGDSEGDFADARWEIWLRDLQAALGWLANRGLRQLTVLGLRAGALLAGDLVANSPQQIGAAVLWQPVVSGRSALTQFLRLRLAANMTAEPDARESTGGLRERLAAGELLEIAGYTLSPELAAALDTAGLTAQDWHRLERLYWLDVVGTQSTGPTPATSKAVAELRERDVQVEPVCVQGEPFWTTPEIATVPALVDATVSLFSA